MKASPILLSLATAALTRAQDLYYNETSAPFKLVVTSDDGNVSGQLSACHVGAALESLCFSGSTGSEFNFNTSVYSQAPEPGFGVPGILTWWLHASNINVSSAALFNYDPTTNLALPIFSPGDDGTMMAFDSQDELTIQGYTQSNGSAMWSEYYRWYTCDTYYASYNYNNLAWGLGAAKPENPSCVAVNVTRVFV